MDIITKTGEIWSENAIGAVISLVKESNDSIEAIWRERLPISRA